MNRIQENRVKKKQDAALAPGVRERSDALGCLVDLGQSVRQSDGFAAFFCYFVGVRFWRIDRFDLVPAGGEFFVRNSVLVDIQYILPLCENAKHGDQVNDEERRGEQKIDKALQQVKREHHREEKDERQRRNDHGALDEDRCGRVGADEFSEVWGFFAHSKKGYLKAFSVSLICVFCG